jgi:hypothetical protein
MKKGRRVAVATIAAIIVPLLSISAQQSSTNETHKQVAWGAIDGSVRDTSGASLLGVEIVSVDNSLIRTRTNGGGAFRIDSISAGPHLIRFRRVGIMPLTVSVVVDPNSITSVDVMLEPFPLTLSRVNVQAKSGELMHLPAGVADRMRTGVGTYITADQIAKMNPRQTLEIFRHVPGIEVDGRPGEEVVSNTRGSQSINGETCQSGMLVVLNGVPLSTSVTQGPTFAGTPAPDWTVGMTSQTNNAAVGVMNTISPKDIAAIEIYKDGAESPATVTESSCGTIFVWTRQ